MKRLRVDVFIDQRDAPFVQTTEPVEITIPERPGVTLKGQVDRIADELDPRTKMMLTEIDIPNEDKSLVAGSFVNVSLRIKSPPYFEAPVEALVLIKNKPFLTVVTPDNTLTYRSVEIVGNDGKLLSIMSGVKEGETVARNVGNAIPEGGKGQTSSRREETMTTVFGDISVIFEFDRSRGFTAHYGFRTELETKTDS